MRLLFVRLQIDPGLIRSAMHDRAAQERLIEQLWPEAFRTSLILVRNREAAADVAQDACVAILRALPTIQDTRRFGAWAYRIVVNRSLSVLRQPRTEALSHDPQAPAIELAPSLDLYAALGRLPPVERAVTLMHYLDGFTSFEIASAAGIPAATVRYHLMRARRRLRDLLLQQPSVQPNETRQADAT